MAAKVQEIASGVAHLPIGIANVYFVGAPGSAWAVVDTGMPGSAGAIRAAAGERYGRGVKPSAIVLTHGHIDHAGSAQALADGWGVPVYAHKLDLPYLTGKSLYPPPDPTVGGPLAFLSRLFPGNGADLGEHVLPLPPDGALPDMPGWEWHFTPGHSPGHVSFFRASDRTLLAGDAFASVNLDSLFALAARKPEISGPPKVITCDWAAARASLERLAGLRPFVIGCGHGVPLSGPQVADNLRTLAQSRIEPENGRYVPFPAVTDESGIISLPPPVPDPVPVRLAAGLGLTILAGVALAVIRRRTRD